MGTVIFSTLITEARSEIFDEDTPYRHSDDKFLGWGNAGQRQMAIYKADVSVSNEEFQLAPGTRQDVPSGCLQFIKPIRNMGTDGSTPGRIIEIEDMELFAQNNPYWHMADASAEVRYCFFDKKDPKRFWNYPPQPGSGNGYIDAVFSVAPANMTAVGNTISVDDIYSDVLKNYLIYRASEKESHINPYATARALRHWNLFVEALGRMDLIKTVNSPQKDQRDAD